MLAAALWAPQPAPAQSDPPPDRLDINRADAGQLVRLPGIGPARAAAIVRIRERNGLFRSVEELRALPRLSEKQFARIHELVTVDPVPGERAARTRPPHP